MKEFKVGDKVHFSLFPDYEVEILATDMGGEWPIVVRFKYPSKIEWGIGRFNTLGEPMYSNPGYRQLVHTPQKRIFERWVNMYDETETGSVWWNSEEDAKRNRGNNCTSCIHIVQEYTEGEGL